MTTDSCCCEEDELELTVVVVAVETTLALEVCCCDVAVDSSLALKDGKEVSKVTDASGGTGPVVKADDVVVVAAVVRTVVVEEIAGATTDDADEGNGEANAVDGDEEEGIDCDDVDAVEDVEDADICVVTVAEELKDSGTVE